MKKFLALRSVGGRARAYADKNLRAFSWFDDVPSALAALRDMTRDERPWLVVVDCARVADMGAAAKAMGLGYVVETRGVP